MGFLCGSLRISASSAFKLSFDAENTEIRRERRENPITINPVLGLTIFWTVRYSSRSRFIRLKQR